MIIQTTLCQRLIGGWSQEISCQGVSKEKAFTTKTLPGGVVPEISMRVIEEEGLKARFPTPWTVGLALRGCEESAVKLRPWEMYSVDGCETSGGIKAEFERYRECVQLGQRHRREEASHAYPWARN